MIRILLALLFATIVFAAVWWQLTQHASTLVSPPARLQTNPARAQANNSLAQQSQEPATKGFATPPETPGMIQPSLNEGYIGHLKLIIPVAGVRPEQLLDTFSDARSEGRVHDAIDIPAPAGTPVLAAADGRIIKLFQSEKGGTTIYQLDSSGRIVFYYAHLQRYADNITEGQSVKQGDILAYVGDSGNAGPGNYHLHFSISVVRDPQRYWDGMNIDPFPLLHQ